MKVRGSTENRHPTFEERVERQTDKDSFSEEFHQQNKRQKQQEEIEVTDENVAKAIDEFSSDEQAKIHGLKATRKGSGPSLEVILTDGSGTVVRQLTGEEFLRLRSTVSLGTAGSGKILDQKL